MVRIPTTHLFIGGSELKTFIGLVKTPRKNWSPDQVKFWKKALAQRKVDRETFGEK